jgi:sarcosine oxidase subunit beta
MAVTAGAVVIGGGVVGASVAFHLAKAGVEHVMLCERKVLGAGASGKTASLVQTHYRTLPDARLGVAALPYFHHWDDVVGAGDPGFVNSGFYALVREEQLEKLEANVAMLRDAGVRTWSITPTDLAEMAPYLRTDDVGGAAYEPDSGFANSLGTINGFVTRAEQLGAEVRVRTEVTDVLTHGGRVTGVETNQGSIDTPIVVHAGGNWAPSLFEKVGLDVPVTGVRAQLAVFEWPPMKETPVAVVIDRISEIYFRMDEANGSKILVGVATIEPKAVPDPDKIDEVADADFLAAAKTHLPERIPAAAYARLVGGWGGHVMVTPDRSPIIDRHPAIDGFYFFTGDSGRSFKTAPAIGAVLSEWALEGAPRTADVRPFRLSRFAEGDQISLATEYDDYATYMRNLKKDLASKVS